MMMLGRRKKMGIPNIPLCSFRGRVLKDHRKCFCRAHGDSRLVTFSDCNKCTIHNDPHFVPLQTVKTSPTFGPGTELKKLLKRIGIEATETCACNKHAEEMNRRGPDWCEANIDTIVSWLRQEAEKRKIKLYSDFIAKKLVQRAIKNARTLQSKKSS